MRCDNRIVYGVAKERQLAKAEHEQALNEGKMTSLVEWVTDDRMLVVLGMLTY